MLVLPDEVVPGTAALRGGLIAEVQPGLRGRPPFGGSHPGKVAAADLAREGAADALASDHVLGPMMIEAAWRCAAETGLPLPQAVATVTDTPARMARLHDRGRIARGPGADLVRGRVHEGLQVTRQVWRAGERVS
ncbi:MAG: hypothetical protein ICV73_14395 [Acetobacteraceae bacterium]|nr:hypothetical protein [Acetobacteraceae bacterium]